MKTNTDKNMEHTAKQLEKIRPKQPEYDFESLQVVINGWIKGDVQAWTFWPAIRGLWSQ